MTELRVAVVGCGAFGQAHAEAWSRVQGARLVAVVDAEPAAAQKLARESAPWATAFEGTQQMLAGCQVDCASVVVSSPAHAGVAQELMKAKVDVLVEKPLAPDVGSAQRIRQVAEQTGCICMPAHVLRFTPAYVALKRGIESGSVGKIIAIHARRDRSAALSTRYPDESPIALTGVHDIDLTLWLSGSPVESVRAVRRPLDTGQPSLVWAHLNHASGLLSSVQATYLLNPNQEGATSDRIDVYGTEGTAFVELAEARNTLQSMGGTNGRSQASTAGQVGLAMELEHFAQCVRERAQSTVITLGEAVHGVAVANAIAESAEAGGELVHV